MSLSSARQKVLYLKCDNFDAKTRYNIMNLLAKSCESGSASPFLLENETAYRSWRKGKLSEYPSQLSDISVPIVDLTKPTDTEIQQLVAICRKTNMVLYRCDQAQEKCDQAQAKEGIRRFGAALGLERLDYNLCSDQDGISALKVVPGGSRAEYIPYSNHAIRWHTDGYYNRPENTIRGMLLHCASPAQEGGSNCLFDPEIVYLLMRDTSPEYIAALMQKDAMTIPANVQDGVQIRAAQSGPVFSVSPSGDLHMRYTARTRSIEWKADSVTQAAIRYLEQLLASDSPFAFEVKLKAGEGLLSNNVLHTRSKFSDGDKHKRLMYRARYFDRIKGTEVMTK